MPANQLKANVNSMSHMGYYEFRKDVIGLDCNNAPELWHEFDKWIMGSLVLFSRLNPNQIDNLTKLLLR